MQIFGRLINQVYQLSCASSRNYCTVCRQWLSRRPWNGTTIPATFPCTLCAVEICHSCKENRITERLNVFCCPTCLVDPRTVRIKRFPFRAWFDEEDPRTISESPTILIGGPSGITLPAGSMPPDDFLGGGSRSKPR